MVMAGSVLAIRGAARQAVDSLPRDQRILVVSRAARLVPDFYKDPLVVVVATASEDSAAVARVEPTVVLVVAPVADIPEAVAEETVQAVREAVLSLTALTS
jgi:hypothetical protein